MSCAVRLGVAGVANSLDTTGSVPARLLDALSLCALALTLSRICVFSVKNVGLTPPIALLLAVGKEWMGRGGFTIRPGVGVCLSLGNCQQVIGATNGRPVDSQEK